MKLKTEGGGANVISRMRFVHVYLYMYNQYTTFECAQRQTNTHTLGIIIIYDNADAENKNNVYSST